MWCKVGKCCFCIDLRKGVITLACICLALDALLVVVLSCLSCYIRVGLKGNWTELEPEERDGFLMTTAGATSSSLAVFVDILLLIGAIKARLKLIHACKRAYAAVYALSLLTYGTIVVWQFVHGSFFFGLLFTACILLHAGLTLYLWVVVSSYCLELDNQHGGCGPRSIAGEVYSRGGLLSRTASPCYTVLM